jgi:putative chitobiose transport system substrate-binding protein
MPLLSLILLLPLLVSCDRADARQSDGKIRLEFWTLALGTRFNSHIEGMVTEFERQNPGVEVVWVDVPFNAMQRKFIAAAAANRAPDVVNLSDGFYARFAHLGGLTDLADHVPGDPAAVYLPAAMTLGRLDGRLYGLPWYLGADVTMANEPLLASGGLGIDRLARTWDGLLAQARDYHRATGRFLFMPLLGQESELPLRILEDGLQPLVPRTDGKPGLQANLLDPAVVEMVERWVTAYRDGIFPRDSATAGHATMVDLYQNGQIAVLVTGPQMLARVRDASPPVFAATSILPPILPLAGKAEIDVMLLSVSSQSRHPKEAARLAWFITNADNQLAFAKLAPIFPSTRLSLNDPLFAAPPAEMLGTPQGKLAYARHTAARSLESAQSFIPAIGPWPQMAGVFSEEIKAALLDGRDVKETLADIDAQWNAILLANEPASPGSLPVVNP